MNITKELKKDISISTFSYIILNVFAVFGLLIVVIFLVMLFVGIVQGNDSIISTITFSFEDNP